MKTFESIASLKLATLKEGQFVETGGYYAKGGSGAGRYFIKTAAQAALDGDVIDGYGNHTLANGNVAILQPSGPVNVKQYGAKGDGVTDDSQSLLDMAVDVGYIRIPVGDTFIDTNITLTVPIYFDPGAYLTINTSKQIDHQSYVESGRQYIFRGAGTFLLGNSGDHFAYPEWYGAFPYDTGGVSTELQKLSDSIEPGRECIIDFSEGTWFLDSKVTWSRACRLRGAGERITHFRCVTGFATGDVFDTSGEGVQFSHIQFSSADTPRTSGRYIAMLHNHCKADHIWFTDGFQGIDLAADYCEAAHVTGFLFSNAAGSHVVNLANGGVGGDVRDVLYLDSASGEVESVVSIGSHASFNVDNVLGRGYGTAAVSVLLNSGSCQNGNISNVIGEVEGISAVSVKTTGTGLVETLNISNVIGTGLSGDGLVLRKEGSSIFKYVSLENVQIDTCGGGISVSASSGSLDNWNLANGYCRNNTGDGLNISDSDNWTVNAFDCVSNGGDGTAIAAGCAGFIYTSNKNLFNTGTNFNDLSGAVTKAVANNI